MRENRERKERGREIQSTGSRSRFRAGKRKEGGWLVLIIALAKATAVNKRTEAEKIVQDAVYDRQGAYTADSEVSNGWQIGPEK